MARAALLNCRYEAIPLDIDAVLHDVNNLGTCVGHWISAVHGMRAIRFESGRITELGTLGGSASSARGINEAGAIVGGALITGDVSHHAFLYEGGVMYDLNSLIPSVPKYELIQALGINDRGDIIAIAEHASVDCVVLLKRHQLAPGNRLRIRHLSVAARGTDIVLARDTSDVRHSKE